MSVARANGGVFVGSREIPAPGGPGGRSVEQGPVPALLQPRRPAAAVAEEFRRPGRPPPTPPPPARPPAAVERPAPIPRERRRRPETPSPYPPCRHCNGRLHSKGRDGRGHARFVCKDCGRNSAGYDAPPKPTRACPRCGGEGRPFGSVGANQRARWRCSACAKTWTDPAANETEAGSRMRAVWARRTEDHKAAIGKLAAARRLAVQTPEARRAGSKKRLKTLGPEKRREIARKARAALALKRAARSADPATTAAGGECRCEEQAPPGYLVSGHRYDGELWTCPGCGRVWRHVSDEAEGGSWVEAGP